jgi:acetyl esterase/lipase
VVIPLVLFGVVSWATVVYIGSNNQTNENGNPSAKNPVDDSGDTSNLVADGNTAVDQPPGIEEAKYTTTPQGSLKIYLDYPADWRADDSRPIVILFHAGACAGGSPVDVKPYTTFFLQKGYITARPEYRVAERHGTGIKEAAEDAKQVVRWVRQNAAKLTVDPSRIIVFGHRVGAHLAACAGTDTPGGDADSSTTSSRPNGMILFSPWVDLKYKPDLATRRGLDQAAATALSPTRHIDRRTPPSIIITASKSKATPVEMVNEFVTEAKRNSVSVEVVMVDVAQPLMPGLWTPNTLRRMEEFLNALKSGKSPTSSETTETATPRLVDVTKIPSTAQVAAYPDLRFFKGQWFCAFREGSSVNSSDGVIRVAKSPKAALWKSCSTISLNGVDLRDPKISETPDNRLMLTCIASRRTPGRLAEIQSYVTFSSDGITWAPLQEIPVGEQHWYWRPVWHDGVCYCITYKIASKTRRAMSLFSSEDGRDYRIVNLQLYSTMLPSEAAMVFLEDDRAICVVRRDGGDKKAVIGKARPPYTDWTWKDLDRSIAGPCLQQLADRRIIVSGRFSEPSTHTGLCWLNVDDGTTEEFLSLPSGGYTGHPSIQVRDNELFVAYFSSHEGATGNYVARLALDTSTDTTFELFNGRDLSGWSVGYLRYTKDKSPKRWVIDKTAEVLRSVGGDQDHLITDDEFENYTLDLEWRFTRGYKSGPNGTGVIVHSPGTSTELDPDGFEVDLRFAEISALIETRSKIVESGGQGMMGTGCIIAYGESITNHSGSANGLVGENNRRHLDWLEPPKIASIYSWNRLSITAVDDQLLVRINDKLVNKAWNLSRQKGRICLRSQNAAVEFRNVTLKQHSN